MSHPVLPLSLTETEMSVLLESAVSLQPGTVVRLEGEEGLCYALLDEIESATPDGTGQARMLTLSLLQGQPAFAPCMLTPIAPEAMGLEVTQLLGAPEHPLSLSANFTGEVLNLDGLTLVQGAPLGDTLRALDGLLHALKPYRNVLVLDPLGVYAEQPDVTVWTLGQTHRLSLKEQPEEVHSARC